MELKAEFGVVVEDLRKQKPVVHCITNYVTAESCADVALAAGASPIMAEDPEEVEEVLEGAAALVLNLGTISFNKIIAMEKAASKARENNIPVILDPVGVMASTMRLKFALQLLKTGCVSIVRGNYSECKALYEEKAAGRGVDNADDNLEKGAGLRLAVDAGKKFGCVFAVTGAVDSISDGKQGIVLNEGHPLLEDITGSGCMTSVLCGCCAAVTNDMMIAAALGVVVMGQSAELAANFLEKKDGPGMFKARLLDCVYHVTTKWNVINLKQEKAN